MQKVTRIAIGLVLAGAAAMATAASGGAQEVWISREGPDRVDVITDTRDGDDTRPVVRRLAVLNGPGVQLGVSVRDLESEQQKTTSGAVVEDVRSGSAAEKAGIQKGDVITEFDGERVRSARHLSRLVNETPEGRTVTAGVLRQGKRVDVTVTPDSGSMALRNDFQELMPHGRFEQLPELEDDDGRQQLKRALPAIPALPDGELFKRFSDEFGIATMHGQGRLGVRVQDLTPQLAEYFGTKDGVLISSVDADSPAAQAGLKAGDVVTRVNGEAVTSGSELVGAVRSADEALAIDYMRERKPASTKATLEPRKKAPARQSVRPI